MRPLPKEVVCEISRLYQTMTHREIARALGIGKTSVDKYAKIYGLTHVAVSRSRQIENGRRKLSEAGKQLLSEKRKAIYKSERRRKVLGIPQVTKCQVSLLPYKIQKVRNSLCSKRGYFFCSDDDWTLYYDGQTRRTPNDAYYFERYRFRFVEAS